MSKSGFHTQPRPKRHSIGSVQTASPVSDVRVAARGVPPASTSKVWLNHSSSAVAMVPLSNR